MNRITILLIGTLLISTFSMCSSRSKKNNTDGKAGSVDQSIPENFHDLSINALDGDTVLHMKDYYGKKILVVNVASKCGYTYQYEDLQKLHDQYGDLVQIIGFPCNQFLFQEPGSNEEIRTFCNENYGVTFPLTEKIDVKGDDRHPIYTWLTSKEYNSSGDYVVSWNFNKFLISESGEFLAHFGTKVEPLSEEIIVAIKS